MQVDRLVELREGIPGERIYLATRPHWFLIARQGAGGLILAACGLALLLFAQQLGRLVVGFTPSLLAPPGLPGSAGTDAPVSVVSVVSVVAPGFEALLDEAFAWGGFAISSAGVLLLGWVALNRHFMKYAITVSPGSP